MSQWMIYTKRADFSGLSERFGITPVLARIMTNRGVREEEFESFLRGGEDNMHSPWLFKDMGAAVDILEAKLKENKKIRVIGDYDIDGVCATYILTDAIKAAGGQTDMDIPDRINDGYGINKAMIDRAANDGADVIITCDNGIAAIEEIDYAKEKGLTVIVTDHHEVPRDKDGVYDRVRADATIDQKQPGCGYPYKQLCGAAVAYKLMEALYERLRLPYDRDKYIQPAAIATIGDVVDLNGENRIIAKRGLELLNHTNIIGIKALKEACGIEGRLTAYHIGFVIGPCLNACGRLETAKKAYELISAGDKETAAELAVELKELNIQRKAMTEEAVERTVSIAERKNDRNVLVIYVQGIHESIAGIVAGRIRERFYRPVIVLTDSGEEGIVKGSGRSIEGYDMFAELSKCKSLFIKFGGHEMAAGLSMKKENVGAFEEMVNDNEAMTEDILTEKLWIDLRLPFSYVTRELTEELSLLEPFGKGNEKPVFAEKDVRMFGFQVNGRNRNVLRTTLKGSDGYSIKAVYFGDIEALARQITERYGEEELGRVKTGRDSAVRLSVAYYPQINTYNGANSVEIVVRKIMLN